MVHARKPDASMALEFTLADEITAGIRISGMTSDARAGTRSSFRLSYYGRSNKVRVIESSVTVASGGC